MRQLLPLPSTTRADYKPAPRHERTNLDTPDTQVSWPRHCHSCWIAAILSPLSFFASAGFLKDWACARAFKKTVRSREMKAVMNSPHTKDGKVELTACRQSSSRPHERHRPAKHPANRKMFRMSPLAIGFAGWVTWATHADTDRHSVSSMFAQLSVLESRRNTMTLWSGHRRVSR